MPTARDKLIANWRDRLAAAEELQTASPGRPAWLARLQVRLYRFLLSLYGDGDWTAPPAQAPRRRETAVGSVIFDSPEAQSLSGKPPKNVGQIQAVLKSVANAQDHIAERGPHLDGITADSWVVAAAKSGNVDPNRLLHLLHRAGIPARSRACGAEVVVEVYACFLSQTLALVHSNRDWLRIRRLPARAPFSSPVVLQRSEWNMWWLLCLMLFVPQVLFALIAALTLGANLLIGEPLFDLDRAFLQLWGASAVAALIAFVPISAVLLWHRWRVHVRQSQQQQQRQPSTGYLAKLAWHCLAAGIFLGPFSGLLVLTFAGRLLPEERPIAFLAGWALAILVAGGVRLAWKDK